MKAEPAEMGLVVTISSVMFIKYIEVLFRFEHNLYCLLCDRAHPVNLRQFFLGFPIQHRAIGWNKLAWLVLKVASVRW